MFRILIYYGKYDQAYELMERMENIYRQNVPEEGFNERKKTHHIHIFFHIQTTRIMPEDTANFHSFDRYLYAGRTGGSESGFSH